MSSSVLTVSQVNSYIKMLLDSDRHLSSVFITGEISNFNNNYRSGHLYFSLKDDKAVIKAVMFSSNASRLRFNPCDGMNVIVAGRVSLYEASGQYQVYVDSMQPDGIGALTVAYEQLKDKLQKEGLFASEHKLPIPVFPQRIGVITSATGAVIQDIKNVISRRYPVAEIVLCPTAVQGEGASGQLTQAVRLFNSLNNVDVIIIGRGGGSFEDLNCFNSEELVREIYKSEIPVISAVGHETDFTLCDFVADMRAPTPSAAAELAVPDSFQLKRNIEDLFYNIYNKVDANIKAQLQDIDLLSEKFSVYELKNSVLSQKAEIDNLLGSINNRIKNDLNLRRLKIDNLADKVNNLSPMNVLKRGYSVVNTKYGVVKSVNELSENESVTVRLSDGTVECTVNSITADKRRDNDERV